MLRVAVCVSGGGTNLQAIIDAAAAGTITNTELALVISNKPGAYALERAKKAGISSEVLVPKDYEDRNAFGEALIRCLNDKQIDLVVLAGYLVILPENFVKAFAKSYYSWSNTQESIEKRTTAINQYLTKSLQDLNVDTVRQDIPTSSTVTDVKIWDIKQAGTTDFTVVYSIDQTVTEGETSIVYTSAYMVVVHVDGDGNLVIIQNPTISSIPTKSSYEPKAQESDGTVDAATTEEVTEFLETFFKLYPTATDKELAYYVEGNALEPINGDYLYSELVNPVFTVDGDSVKVSVAVKFIDNQTKATQISQYELTLHKDSNWKIV